MKSKANGSVLGIAATSRVVQAVLLREGPDGLEVLRRFSRQRSRGAGLSPSAVGAMHEPAHEQVGSGQDFTIQFGDAAGAGRELFLASEFGGLDREGGDESGASASVATFELELRDLLDECRDSGYDAPTLGFALAAADAAFVEVRVPEAGKPRKPDHAHLVELLTQQHRGLFEEERVAFLPMTPGEDGLPRYLAVFPKLTDPVAATLRTMRDEKERLPLVGLIDAEVPLLAGLARLAQRQLRADAEEGGASPEQPPADATLTLDVDADPYAYSEADSFTTFAESFSANAFAPRRFTLPPDGQPLRTLVVRAGFEDTLVLFMQGEVVQHCESLRSLTAFDAPETLCSRVLLQQDEHGLGDVHHVVLLSEERERELIETFEMFFPDARVEALRDHLPRQDDGQETAGAAVVAATAAALRLCGSPAADTFDEINFLPKKLARRRVEMPFTWHMAALSVMIVFTSLFFAASYSNGAGEIESYRERIGRYSDAEVATDLRSLQAGIDSMQAVHQTYIRALQVLDTLLVGSDRWSRALEGTAQTASAVKGVWIESMVPSATGLQLVGTATSRERVVTFAQRIEGTIQTLAFSEIREWPVYTFEMQVPVRNELPEAARYLREQVELPEPAAPHDALHQ